MNLRKWLKKNKITVTAFAALLQVHRTYIHHLMKGSKIPSKALLQKIISISGGIVKTLKTPIRKKELCQEEEKEKKL